MRSHSTRAPDAPSRTFAAASTLRADRRERRDRIIAAAQALMLEVDHERIQVKDVAAAGGVSLGTLYRYFNSKDHLFACVLLSWAAGFGEHLDRSTSGPTLANVKAVYRRAATAFARQPRVYAVLIQVQSSPDPHAREVFRAFAQQQSGAFAAALATSRLSDEKRADIVAVMNAVLDQNLRSWQLGLQPVDAVMTAIDRAADLILAR